MTPKEVLEKALAKISSPDHWCQGALGRAADGNTDALDDAVRFCAAGAIFAVTQDGDECWAAQDVLRETIHEATIVEWNDSATHAQVVEAFREAIASLS